MGSQWTDKSAIMRDLSFAQGRWVPGGIDAAVASGKPPTHNITEETEEEYFKRWTTDGDFSTGPDLSLISKMLEMVHGEVPDTQQDTQTGPIEIKKLNPVAKVFVPKFKKTVIKETHQNIEAKPVTKKTEKKEKPLRERNVAIASIIANSGKMEPPLQDYREGSIKLSKPEDFIKKTAIPKKNDSEEVIEISRRKDSVNKVNSWLQSQDMRVMFKKKSTDSVKSPLQSDKSVKSPPNIGQYVPSSWAEEYYKKCIDRTHIKDMVQETVWVRAEKLMKDIDIQKAEEQRKQEEEEAVLAAAMAAAERDSPPGGTPDHHDSGDKSDQRDDTPGADLQGLASMLLPRHRHQLTGDCIVCKVLSEPPAHKETLFETNPEDLTVKPEKIQAQEVDGNQEEDFFSLVRSSNVENLTDNADIEAIKQNLMPLEDSGSTEVLDISTSES